MDRKTAVKDYKIEITKLPAVNLLKIKKDVKDGFFYANDTTIVITIPAFAYLISFLVKSGFMSHKVLEGILEEYNSTSFERG